MPALGIAAMHENISVRRELYTVAWRPSENNYFSFNVIHKIISSWSSGERREVIAEVVEDAGKPRDTGISRDH